VEPARRTDAPGSQPESDAQPGMSGGRIVLVVAGILVSLLALAAVASGAGLLVVNHTERDSAGFFSTGQEPFRTNSYALVSEEVDIGTDGPDWLFEEGRLATVRLRGSSEDGREIFLGIAPASQVRSYLAGTRHDVVTDFDVDPFRATYRSSPGTSAPAEPASQTFWSASASGSGSQSIEWDVAEGNWSVVVMNADASPGVDVELSVGAKVGFIFWVGLGLLIFGVILLAGGATMIFFGLRRPATTPSPSVSAPAE
jgi:hypothetical protein